MQSWNVTFERQIGSAWQASVSYLGSYADRMWGQAHINPATFMGLGPCTIAGVSYPSCTVSANTDRRRTLFLENPDAGQWLGPIVRYVDAGTQSYRGLKLSGGRRAANGLSLAANYTLSHCVADTDVSGGFSQFTGGYTKPDDPSFDRGNCSQSRRQIVNASVGAQTPALRQRGDARHCVRLARLGHHQRAQRRLADRDDDTRHRGHGHHAATRQPGEFESLRRQVAGQLPERGGVRIAPRRANTATT